MQEKKPLLAGNEHFAALVDIELNRKTACDEEQAEKNQRENSAPNSHTRAIDDSHSLDRGSAPPSRPVGTCWHGRVIIVEKPRCKHKVRRWSFFNRSRAF